MLPPQPITNGTREQWSARHVDDGTMYEHDHLPLVVYQYEYGRSGVPIIDGYYCNSDIPPDVSTHNEFMSTGVRHLNGHIYRTDGPPDDYNLRRQQCACVTEYLQRHH